MGYQEKFKAADGAQLHGLRYPARSPRAAVVALHGLGEHIARYDHMAQVFSSQGVSFYGADMRGHGESPGKRGQAAYQSWVQDASAFIQFTAKREDAPLFLFGHSLGGNLALYLLLTQQLPIAGAIVTSPWLTLVNPLSGALAATVDILGAVLPGITLDNRLGDKEMYHGEKASGEYTGDPLVHGRISLGMARGASRAAAYSLSHAGDLQVPLFLVQGSDDPVCAADGARNFAKGAGALCRYYEYPGLYHELHHEAEKADLFSRELAFIDQTLRG